MNKCTNKDSQICLHLGSGKRFIPGFEHVDLADYSHIDHRHDIRTLPMYEDGSVELIYACHVLEYFDRVEVVNVLEEWHRVLVDGGILRVAVPDLDGLVAVYLSEGQLGMIHGPLYGRWEIGDEVFYHRTVYNYPDLRQLLWSTGFSSVRKYDWRDTIHKDYDDYSQAYIPHMDKMHGLLISLNVECRKGLQ